MKKMKKLLALMCIAIAALIWLPGLKFPVEAGGIDYEEMVLLPVSSLQACPYRFLLFWYMDKTGCCCKDERGRLLYDLRSIKIYNEWLCGYSQ